METKTKQNKKSANHGEWKNLVQGFVGNMLEQLSENVTNRVHAWTKQMKRRTIGSILMLLGATYFLSGLADYAGSLFGKDFPGFGSGTVGIVVIFIGYLLSRK